MNNFLSPQKISINNLKNSLKKIDSNSPSKSAKKEDNYLSIAQSEGASKKVLRKASYQLQKQSAVRSQASQVESDHSKKTKLMLKEYLQRLVQNLHPYFDEAETEKLQSAYKNLNEAQTFSNYLQQFFRNYNYYHSIVLKNPQQEQIAMPLKYKQAKRIILTEEVPNVEIKSNRIRKINQLTKENQELKKDAFRLRESVKELEKRLLFLIEQFKQRKAIYLREIEKLTNIVQTSIKGIPDLIASKQQKTTKTYTTVNQLSIPTQQPKLVKKDTDYNILFYEYNKQSNNNSQKYSQKRPPQQIFPPTNQLSLQRYKSQTKVRHKE